MKLNKLLKMKNEAFKVLIKTKNQLNVVITESYKRIIEIEKETYKLESEKFAIESIATQSEKSIKEISRIIGE